MSNLLKNNAYHILGLDASASQKDILKRSKEIINRLKVDDSPEYDFDIPLFENYRTGDSVKEATQKLQSSKKRIREHFFWLLIVDDIDEEVLSLIKKKDYPSAIRVWQDASEGNTVKSYLYRKNLAVLYCLLLNIKDDVNYLRDSLSTWKVLIDSEKFWTNFSKAYKLHDEQTTSQELIDDFKGHAIEYLSDIYTELYKLHGNNDYIAEFQKIFSVKGEKVDKEILNPVFRAINSTVEDLEAMKISEDGVIDQTEIQKIKSLIKSVQSELNKLIDLGLYDNSQTKVMRDRAANALRGVILDLHNELNQTAMALGLAKIANQISGTESFRMKMEQDLKTLQENFDYKEKEEKYKKIIDPIIAKMKAGKVDEAISIINGYIYSENTDGELKETLLDIKKTLEERVVKHGKPIKSGPTMYTINGIGSKVYGDTLYFVVLFIPLFPIARYTLTNHGDGTYSFYGKLTLHKWQKIWLYSFLGIIAIWILSSL